MGIARRLIFVTFLGVGIAQLAWCISESRGALTSADWPTTGGTIIFSEVVVDTEVRGTAYIPTVSYSYAVDGIPYTGKKIHYGTGNVSEMPDQAQRTIRQFPLHSRVTVYYQPNNAEESVLRPGIYWYSYVWFALSLLAIIVGGIGTLWPRSRKVVLGVA
jgi:hypothetical protein